MFRNVCVLYSAADFIIIGLCRYIYPILILRKERKIKCRCVTRVFRYLAVRLMICFLRQKTEV